MVDRLLSTKELLKKVPISRRTLFRWLKVGLIKQPKRNGRGYMFWSEQDTRKLREFIKERYTPR